MRKNFFWYMVVILILFVDIVVVFIAQNSIVRKSVDETHQVLDASARQQTRTIIAELNGLYSVLESFANSEIVQKNYDYSDILQRMNAVVETKSNGFVFVALSGKDGVFYVNDGTVLNGADRDYFIQAIAGNRSIQRIDNARLDGGSRFIITAPIKSGEEIVGVVLGSISVKSVEGSFVSELNEQGGYSIVCNSSGDIILNDESVYRVEQNRSMLDIIGSCSKTSKSVDDFKSDLLNQETGTLQYTYNGQSRFALYRYLGYNDWMIINVLPQSVVDNKPQPLILESWIIVVVPLVSILLIAFIFVRRERALVREQENRKIQLMLSQIKPHFLYNTLSAIRALIVQDPPVASKLVYDFSHYMRNNIDVLTSNELIPFSKELAHIKTYAEIEKVRFIGLITVEFDIAEENFLVPPLSVQPFVENAIKHGLRGREEGGTVIVRSVEENGSYVITVEDNGVGFEPAERHLVSHSSTGMKNVEYRLKQMCGGTVKVDSTLGVGTVVTIKIPVKRGR